MKNYYLEFTFVILIIYLKHLSQTQAGDGLVAGCASDCAIPKKERRRCKIYAPTGRFCR